MDITPTATVCPPGSARIIIILRETARRPVILHLSEIFPYIGRQVEFAAIFAGTFTTWCFQMRTNAFINGMPDSNY